MNDQNDRIANELSAPAPSEPRTIPDTGVVQGPVTVHELTDVVAMLGTFAQALYEGSRHQVNLNGVVHVMMAPSSMKMMSTDLMRLANRIRSLIPNATVRVEIEDGAP